MTIKQKGLINKLLKNPKWFMRYFSHDLFSSEPYYILYNDGEVAEERVPIERARVVIPLFKEVPMGYNLNLRKVRRLHGNTWIKRKYKEFKKNQHA